MSDNEKTITHSLSISPDALELNLKIRGVSTPNMPLPENTVTVPNSEKDFLHQLLNIEIRDINLKFIFDNVRNYGTAAGVIVAGYYLKTHGAIVSQLPDAGIIFGILFVIIGMLLLLFNFAQAMLALTKIKMHKILYMFVSIIMFFGAMELTMVLVNQVGKSG